MLKDKMVGAQTFNKKTIKEWDLSGKRVLLRADYNAPITNGQLDDDYRLIQSVPTIKYIMEQPGSSLVIISHLGRPDGQVKPEFSLKPVAERLSQLIEAPVAFAGDTIGEQAKTACSQLQPGQVLLLENVRFHPEEEKNDDAFAKEIIESTGAQLFVQDGFGVVHRAHASTEAIARQSIPAIAGLLLENEVATITSAMQSPERPLVAVVGGAKVSDKIDVLEKFIDAGDGVAIGGALANNFLVAAGVGIGNSKFEPEEIETAKTYLEKARKEEQKRDFNFFMPVDVVVSTAPDGKKPTRIVDIASHSLADIVSYPKQPDSSSFTVAKDEMILDIGPISAAYIAGAAKMAKTVVWAGTLGVTEAPGIAGAQPPFSHGTRMVVDAMIGNSNNHKNKPFTIVGGGDTVSYVQQGGLLKDFNHVSTGGSASLDLMSGAKLPGVEVLWDKDG